MCEIIIFLLACYGTTNIIVSSKIFKPLRDWLDELPSRWKMFSTLIHCPLCLAFWVGIFWYLCGLMAIRASFAFVAAGAVSSGFTWIIRVILYKLGEDDL